ncbi:Ribosomal_protein S18 [Hexamita inflata]|uniref:Ribosomal protein S18 n=1 Tax=Hexamita inflata TaxID=28002 RepID=A0AA86R105_9EUKA|nr:Ribosomal protein S18 [Hexamita inflata]CAI9957785.1 Ribosomal protein S18 [Hexamita inflata]CAI9968265.1 Ribosomal protein S18 [Hexamita inflata]
MNAPVRSTQFRDLLRMFNTNVDGKYVLGIALTQIKGVGRRFAKACCQKAGLDPNMRAGEISEKDEENLIKIITEPVANGLPLWMINHQKEMESGLNIHLNSNMFSQQWRIELERLRRAKANRGIRHQNGIKVRGQRTKCTGRNHGVVGVQRKK